MSYDDTLDQVIEVIKEVMKVDDIDEETYMQEDLHIESLEFYALLAKLEKKFKIRIPERVLAQVETVGDIADEVEKILSR